MEEDVAGIAEAQAEPLLFQLNFSMDPAYLKELLLKNKVVSNSGDEPEFITSTSKTSTFTTEEEGQSEDEGFLDFLHQDENSHELVPFLEKKGPLYPASRYSYDNASVSRLFSEGANIPKPLEAPYVYQVSPDIGNLKNLLEHYCKIGILSVDRPVCAFQARTVQRNSGKLRLIIDLSPWNDFYEMPAYSSVSVAQAITEIGYNSLMCVIVLKEPFLQIPIKPSHRIYYGVQCNEDRYVFNRLPEDHPLAPALMQKWENEVAREVKNQFDVAMICHHGNWLIHDVSLTEEKVQDIVRFLTHELGITLNPEKCMLIPHNELAYHGVKINTYFMEVSLTPACLHTLYKTIYLITKLDSVQLNRASGFISSVCCLLSLPSFLVSDCFDRNVLLLNDFWVNGVFHKQRKFAVVDKILKVNIRATPSQASWSVQELNQIEVVIFPEETTIYFAEGWASLAAVQKLINTIPQDNRILVHTNDKTVSLDLNHGRGDIFSDPNCKSMYLFIMKNMPQVVTWMVSTKDADNQTVQD